MTGEQFAEHLFGIATGWLGWTPEVALHTPMPQIYVALKARVRWLAIQNGRPDPDETPADRIQKQLRRLQSAKER
jgi:hypothetical protein